MIKINLITVRIPKDHLVVQRQVMALVGAVILSFVIAGWWASHAGATRDELQGQLDSEKAKLQRLEQVAKKIEEFEKKKVRREAILETIKKLEAQKVGPRLFLDDLNVMLPADVWLTKINEVGAEITVAGYSFSNSAIADLMRSMETSPNFENVELTQITNEVMKGEDVKNFTVTCTWETLAKLQETKKDGAPAAPAKK